MPPSTGYYSILQYVPDPSRLEGANVGVLLFVPDRGFLKALTARDNRRIRRFFGDGTHDWNRINSFKHAVEERVQSEAARIRTREDLGKFVAERANRFRLTEPRPMRVTNPEADLAALFAELVGGKPRLSEHHPTLRSYLREKFDKAGLGKKIQTDIRVMVPSYGRQLDIPFGYYNGRFNLIQPASFKGDDEQEIYTRACRYAVDGEDLFDHPHPDLGRLQLLVVGQFSAKNNAGRMLVERVFDKKHVRLFSAGEIDRLIRDIKEHGKEQPLAS